MFVPDLSQQPLRKLDSRSHKQMEGRLTSDASNLTLMKIFLAFLDLPPLQLGSEQHGSSSQGKLYSIHWCHGNTCRCWAFSSQNILILVRNSFTSLFFCASNSCNPGKCCYSGVNNWRLIQLNKHLQHQPEILTRFLDWNRDKIDSILVIQQMNNNEVENSIKWSHKM